MNDPLHAQHLRPSPSSMNSVHDQTPPYTRSESPSSDISPSAALSPCPPLERSFSGASSVASSFSGRSTSGPLGDAAGPGAGRRRGYIRPQATVFADSARNRDSVMSLGSITHLQYYFARTGLLDGKGAQFAKEAQNKDDGTTRSGDLASPSPIGTEPDWSAMMELAPHPGRDSGYAETTSDQSSVAEEWPHGEGMPLPPTYSTYKQKPTYVQPPPDLSALRRELREALADASKLLVELERSNAEAAVDVERNAKPWPTSPNRTPVRTPGDDITDGPSPRTPRQVPQPQGWYEIQGFQVLDLVTLAIRAAKNYYTAHERPQRLYAIKSERAIRADLYAVLDVLKRMAARNFAGGVRRAEKQKMNEWMTSISDLLSREERAERAESAEREAWVWRTGDWSGREREREWLFLQSFDDEETALASPLPRWTQPPAPSTTITSDAVEAINTDTGLPTPFLQALQSGLRLVYMHNRLVRSSKRQFEEIRSFHTDTAKPYRCSENLQFWIKAAERRWDIKLDLDAVAVAAGTDAAMWRQFDAELLRWCQAVRQELTNEWDKQENTPLPPPVVVRVDGGVSQAQSVH